MNDLADDGISVQLIAFSQHPDSTRPPIATFEVEYPRFAHVDFVRHRSLSRTASSSRAKGTKYSIHLVRTRPCRPRVFLADARHLAHGGELPPAARARAEALWNLAAQSAVYYAQQLEAEGLHRQYVNRILEPFLPTREVITATDWRNVRYLRRGKRVQPELVEVVRRIGAAYDHALATDRNDLRLGWHLPYITDRDLVEEHAQGQELLVTDALRRRSIARCADVTYRMGQPTPTSRTRDEELALYDRLTTDTPRHLAVLEHVAAPADTRHLNFRYWKSLRAEVGEDIIEP